MREKSYFFSGITELMILAVLSKKDSYVYEMTKFLKETSNGVLSISQNTVYAATYKLENEGFLSHYSKLVGKRRTRVYYHIEPSGEKYFEDFLALYKDSFEGVNKVLMVLSDMEDGADE